jgi:hypothetical protein
MLPRTPQPVVEHKLDVVGDRSFKVRIERWKQERPYNLPLPYTRWENGIDAVQIATNQPDTTSPPTWCNVCSQSVSAWGSHDSWVAKPPGYESSLSQEAIAGNKREFLGKIGARANLAQALVERRQTMELLGSRMAQLARFALAVKRGRFGDARRILDPRGSLRDKLPQSSSRSLSNAWLQWWFGVSPLLADISSAVKVLDSPLGERPVSTVVNFPVRQHSTPEGVRNFGTGVEDYVLSDRQVWRCRMQATVRIDNPNLFLYASLGFTNPAVLAYEVIPFSFVANWFINIEEYLQQFTEFHGVTLVEPQHTVTFRRATKVRNSFTYTDGSGYYRIITVTASSSGIYRRLGIPDVTLGFRRFERLSPTRAATIASLLVQRFISSR